MLYSLGNGTIAVDFEKAIVGEILINGGDNIIFGDVPMFAFKMRRHDATYEIVSAGDCKYISFDGKTAVYSHEYADIKLDLCQIDNSLSVRAELINKTDMLPEWFELMSLGLNPKLCDEGGQGAFVYPYNEGCLVTDMQKRMTSWFGYNEPEYPSIGAYSVFPNMICSQFLGYQLDGCGVYFGMHDKDRTTKHIDFRYSDNCIKTQLRTCCNSGYGEDFSMDYDFVIRLYKGEWQDACEIYRRWFENNLPDGAVKIKDNKLLPDWYGASPIVVTYPVRGRFDTDEMTPNKMYPYKNAFGLLSEISEKTDSRVMTLIMHWEGSAPWAPPYVWPPFGGEEQFCEFVDQAHSRNMLVGVYCSGMGWTQKSNILPSYEKTTEFEDDKLSEIMCSDSDGRIEGKICTAQRSGYDLCPAVDKTKQILSDEMAKISTSKVDYTQAFDQNHGGCSYFCYSDKHGHKPAPGKWQVREVLDLLHISEEKMQNKMLVGCESAAAEPFIGHLQFSDNRFELNYHLGSPLPIYSYLYHEYLNNFMGNQVCMCLSDETYSYPYRVAYSFVCGDMLTAVVDDNGNIAYCWGNETFFKHTDRDEALTILKNLNGWRTGIGKKYLHTGKAVKPISVVCGKNRFEHLGLELFVDKLLTSAFEYDGETAQFIVNYNSYPIEVALDCPVDVFYDSKNDMPSDTSVNRFTVDSLSAVMIVKHCQNV